MGKTKDILQATDDIRNGLNGAISRRQKSEIGQFLTPSPIARFMASLFGQSREQVRILDAGAGAGALFGALVTKLCSRAEHPHAIEVAAYENDEALQPYSSFFDKYFRLFSGHTQVNATDLRKMRYPSREELIRLGAHVGAGMPDLSM